MANSSIRKITHPFSILVLFTSPCPFCTTFLKQFTCKVPSLSLSLFNHIWSELPYSSTNSYISVHPIVITIFVKSDSVSDNYLLNKYLPDSLVCLALGKCYKTCSYTLDVHTIFHKLWSKYIWSWKWVKVMWPVSRIPPSPHFRV